MIAVFLCLALIAGAVLWGSFGGHEVRCQVAVFAHPDHTGVRWVKVPCNATPEAKAKIISKATGEHPLGAPGSN